MNQDSVRYLANENQTPLYVYSRSEIERSITEVQEAFGSMPFGSTIRYAVKANPHPEILKIMLKRGIQIDASSEYEAVEAMNIGIESGHILLTSQQLPRDKNWLKRYRVPFTATSLHQLEQYGLNYPNSTLSIRLNTGLGSGVNHRLTTGGIEVGFGIWFHDSDNSANKIKDIIGRYNLKVERIHIHIGTGTDPSIWSKLMEAGIEVLRFFPEAHILNLGGGFKIARMKGEVGADLPAIGQIASNALNAFQQETGRQIHLEVEPGHYLVGKGGSIISTIIDRSNTGDRGDDFLKLDTGMTEFIRTAMYGSQHPLVVVPRNVQESAQTAKYVVIGHCCESSDILTTKPGNPDEIEPRLLQKAVIGDYMVLEMTGAYCASMSAKGYNSFPVAKEIVID